MSTLTPQARGSVFLLGRAVWHDPAKPVNPFGLNGIITQIVPPEGMDFPYRVDRLFAYAQLSGDPGEYRLWVRLVRISQPRYDEEEVQLGIVGEPADFPMPGTRVFEISGLNFVDEIAFPIFRIEFPHPAVYEFQLWATGGDEPISRTRIQARR